MDYHRLPFLEALPREIAANTSSVDSYFHPPWRSMMYEYFPGFQAVWLER